MEGKSTSNVSTAESLNIAADDMQRALNQHRPAPATEAVGGLTDEDEGIETALRYARFIASEINSEESRHPVQDIDGEYWPARLHSLCERALNQRLAGKVGAPNLSEIVANKSAQIDALIGDPWGRTNPDTRRYQRLRILGAAPSGSDQLANGTVLRFQSLDAFLDADLDRHPSRGEPTTQAGVTEVDVDYLAARILAHLGFSQEPSKERGTDRRRDNLADLISSSLNENDCNRIRHFISMPQGLHFDTAKLVKRFARAMANKLHAAEKKYGYSNGWMRLDWMDECREHLMQHIIKGDPRDVAAYCAFLWHHGESTTSPTPDNNATQNATIQSSETIAAQSNDEKGATENATQAPAEYKERCAHGVSWERRCFACIIEENNG